MKYKIVGDNLQMVVIELNPGEKVIAEAGALNHMSGNIKIEARARGGFAKGILRKIAGESFFMTEFTSVGGPGVISFSGVVPGKIAALHLDGTKEYYVQRGAFLAATEGIDISPGIARRLGAALFGGEGIILEKISGIGTVFIHAAGDFVEYDLKPGQVLKVDTGQLVGFESTVDYDIERIGGIRSILFAGEGIFLAKMRGPGKVIVQSMNVKALASTLSRYISRSGRSGFTITLGGS
ncbi:MAG: TIGR00266 family protein [Thermoproteota archaeon]|nr:MAG: TIGR00266 family protein [Candidatus Korarchaeota archaeon]